MDITITINTDNDAFTANCESEVARILNNYVCGLFEGLTAVEPRYRQELYDCNGNRVGKITITDRAGTLDPR